MRAADAARSRPPADLSGRALIASRADLQRASGGLDIAFGLRSGRTVLRDLHQEGCLKARFPRPVARVEAVLLNSSGGIAGGDRLRTGIVLADAAEATIAGQAAERCYRALPADPPALVRTVLDLGEAAALEWLPQETILFDGCALDRQLRVRMRASARFLGIEALVFGRAAMGEQVRRATLCDLIRVERDGIPVLHDAIQLRGEVAATLARPAVAGANRAVATLVFVAPDAAARLDAVRAALAGCDAETGASAWDGMLIARVVARDERCLRAAIVAAGGPLRDGRPWPRVWQC